MAVYVCECMDGWNGPSIGRIPPVHRRRPAQEYQDRRIWLRVGECISYMYEMEREKLVKNLA